MLSLKLSFKYILCSYLSIMTCWRHVLGINSNTSYVLIYLVVFQEIVVKIQIQIHPMFLFILGQQILSSANLTFKYILCSTLYPI